MSSSGKSLIRYLSTKERLNLDVVAREKAALVYDVDEKRLYVVEEQNSSGLISHNQIITVADGGVPGGGTPATPETYTNLSPAPVAIGSIQPGDTFSDVPIVDMITKIIYSYLSPAFTSYSLSGQATVLEVGDQISSGSKTFIWGTSNSGNVNPNSLNIIDVTNSNTVLASGLANDGNETVTLASAIQKLSSTSHVFRITGQNTNLVAMTPRDFTVNWQWRMHWGFSPNTSVNSADILGFGASKLANNRNGVITLPANFGTNYDYICYPDSWGAISNIIDLGSGFSLLAAYSNEGTIVHTNSYGASTNYRIYKSTTASAGKTGWNLQIS